MLNIIVNGARVSYDSLEEAKKAAQASGLGFAFWREPLSACADKEAMWNDLLNDLWQSGAEDEAERLDRAFPKDVPRHWLLVALTLDGGDPWRAFLAAWKAQGDGWILPVVSAPAFVPWLKQVQPERHGLLVRAFGEDAATWPDDLLLKALKAEGTAAEVAEWQAVVEEQNESKLESVQPEPKPGDEMTITLPGGVPMTFCWCPATTSDDWTRISGGNDFFWMGSPDTDPDACWGEILHRVTLTQGFWMGKYEVTQRQWESVMGSNPSYFNGHDRPVERVSWDDCQAFVRKINVIGKVCVSLPTEAQWEYACRAGATTPFSYGSTLDGDKANCNDTGLIYGSDNETSNVGLYSPNAWGLYDMHGNVLEWCQDWFGSYVGDSTDPVGPTFGKDRIARGGDYDSPSGNCRSAYRSWLEPGRRDDGLGLRLVCSAGPRR